MRLRDRVDDRETEADAALSAGARGVGAREALEDLRERLLGDARPSSATSITTSRARCT